MSLVNYGQFGIMGSVLQPFFVITASYITAEIWWEILEHHVTDVALNNLKIQNIYV